MSREDAEKYLGGPGKDRERLAAAAEIMTRAYEHLQELRVNVLVGGHSFSPEQLEFRDLKYWRNRRRKRERDRGLSIQQILLMGGGV